MRMFNTKIRARAGVGLLAVTMLSIGELPLTTKVQAASAETDVEVSAVGPDPAESASNPLSDAGMGGYVYYRLHCQSCHGHLGSGTKKASALLNTAYSQDYTARKAFHKNFRHADRRHVKVARGTRKRPGPRFNELEMIAKFLREVEAWHTMLEANKTGG